eukprot:scaffold115531_cov60-Phaeocystis_antarctica.AAC.2
MPWTASRATSCRTVSSAAGRASTARRRATRQGQSASDARVINCSTRSPCVSPSSETKDTTRATSA